MPPSRPLASDADAQHVDAVRGQLRQYGVLVTGIAEVTAAEASASRYAS